MLQRNHFIVLTSVYTVLIIIAIIWATVYVSIDTPVIITRGGQCTAAEHKYSSDASPTWHSMRGDAANTGRSSISISKDIQSHPNHSISSIHLGGIIWGTAIADSKNNIYVGSSNKYFYCISTSNNKIVWKYKIFDKADALIDSAAALNKDETVVVVPGGDGYLHALDTKTGKRLWLFEAAGASAEEHLSGVIVNSFEGNVKYSIDGTKVYAGCDNGNVYCLDASTGQQLWKFTASDGATMIWTVVAFLEDYVIFGGLDGYLYILHADTGLLATKYYTTGEIKSSPLCISNDSIFVCNSGGDVLRLSLDQKTHYITEIWHANVHDEVYSSPLLLSDGIVVVTMGGLACKFDFETGSLCWTTSIGTYSTSSPIVSQDGVIIVGNSDGRLVAISANSGELMGCLKLSDTNANLNASPMLLSNSNIVIGSYDGNVYIVAPGALLGKQANDKLTTRENVWLQQVSDADAIITCFRLNAPDGNGGFIKHAAIDPNSLVVQIDSTFASQSQGQSQSSSSSTTPSVYSLFDIRLSPDGGFINFVPTSAESAAYMMSTRIRIHVSAYYGVLSDSWVRDRVKDLMQRNIVGQFETYVEFGGYLSNAKSKTNTTDNSYTDIIRIDVGDMRIPQPIILDTYVPAGAAGQGFILYMIKGKSQNKKQKVTGIIIPASPGATYEALPEPSKVVLLEGNVVDNVVEMRALSSFSISSMGCTMKFTDLRFFGRFDDNANNTVHINFYAQTSCLNIKANGKSYNLSNELVNKLCDQSLDTHIIANLTGKINPDMYWKDKNKDIDKDIYKLDEHLIINYDHQKNIMEAHVSKENSSETTFKGCNSITIIDGLLYNIPNDNNQDNNLKCWKPLSQGHGILSLDRMIVTNFLQSLVDLCCTLGIHPNAITISSMITTIAMLFILHYSFALYAIPLLMMYKWFADLLDGPVARRCRKTSTLGGVLDSAADMLFTATVYIIISHMLRPKASTIQLIIEAIVILLLWIAASTIIIGTNVLYDHEAMKNEDHWLTWIIAENSVVVIGIFAIAFIILFRRWKNKTPLF